MTDYYVWIDPFAEIERANQRAAYAREQGRNDVLEHEYRQPGLLRRAIEDQAYRIAERVVEEQIRPHFADAMTRKRVQDATLQMLALTPMNLVLSHVDDRLSAAPVYDARDRGFGVMTEVQMKPFLTMHFTNLSEQPISAADRPAHIPDHQIEGLLPRGDERRERFEDAYNKLHELFQRLDDRFAAKL